MVNPAILLDLPTLATDEPIEARPIEAIPTAALVIVGGQFPWIVSIQD